MEERKVRVECRPTEPVTLDELNDFQGNLKNLDEKNYVKLRNSITEYGFSFPLFIWIDESGKKWINDGHQRNRVLLQMRQEGWEIPALPAFEVIAKDRIEAKKKLLLASSRYGQMTESGLTDFINEEGYSFSIDEIDNELSFPEFEFADDDDNSLPKNNELDPREIAKNLNITCPKCGFQFQGKEGIEKLDATS